MDIFGNITRLIPTSTNLSDYSILLNPSNSKNPVSNILQSTVGSVGGVIQSTAGTATGVIKDTKNIVKNEILGDV